MPRNRPLQRGLTACLALMLSLGSCARGSTTSTAVAASVGSWTDLLDAPATRWRGYQRESLPAGWRFDPATRELTVSAGGGDLVTTAQYGDFEIELEWKASRGANSGLFLRAVEATPRIYENATEMQILDDAVHADGRNPLTSAGSNFGLYAIATKVAKPAGEWNAVRVVARGAHVEHWLNGTKVVQYEMGSPDWVARVKASKFNQWPSYGQSLRGHIGLQDHGDVVAFRNIRIRELR